MTLDQILQWLSGPGLETAIGFLLFTIWPDLLGKSWEEVVPPNLRRPIFIVICLVLPTLAAMLRVWLGYVAFNVDTVLIPALLAGGAAYVASTIALGFQKLPGIQAFRSARAAKQVASVWDESLDVPYRWTG